eukprot:SAG31_NODE_796_length_12032_cov_21.073242_3_plen_84_part_00
MKTAYDCADGSSAASVLPVGFAHLIFRRQQDSARIFDSFELSTKVLHWQRHPTAFDDEVRVQRVTTCFMLRLLLNIAGALCHN